MQNYMQNLDHGRLILIVPESLQINDIAEFYTKFPFTFNDITHFKIDAHLNTFIDAAGLQLLLFYVQAALAVNACIEWDPMPLDEFIAKTKRVGVFNMLLITGENNETHSHCR